MNRISERVNIAACLGLALLILLPIGRAEGASDNESKLLDLAKKNFKKFTLTQAEEKLFRKVFTGEFADCNDRSGKNNDPNGAKEWDEDTRVIRAKCIAWLCTDPEASAMVTHKGIHVKGARIDGELDLEFGVILFPLRFIECAFAGGINLRYAEIRELHLIGTYTGPIYGDGANIGGSVYLRNGFKAEGEVCLLGAKIGRNLECDGSQFINHGGYALNAGGLNIEGYVFLRNGFKAEGEVRLAGATIGRNLECDGSQFINHGGYALNAKNSNIKSSVFLRNGFKAEGEVNLVAARIGVNLDCGNGQFINKGATTLNADSIDVKGDVFLRDGFQAKGQVDFEGATIGKDLICDGGQFINKGAKALVATGVNVNGSIYLRDGFRAEGVVHLSNATIGDRLDFIRGELINPGGIALQADGVNVGSSIFFRGGFKAEGVVDLTAAIIHLYFMWINAGSPESVSLCLWSAKVGTLYDDVKSWPDEGRLFLHGLVYNEIDDKAPRDAKKRIDWLRLQPGFRPQPYEQLAAVLRKSGQDDDAKKILIAKNEDRARLTKLTRSEKWWYSVLGPMIGYGYRPLNALWGAVAFVVLGWVLFGIGYWSGLVTPQNESAYVGRSVTTVDGGAEVRELSDVYPRFNFLVYSLDVFVPLIDLHQAKYWLPNASRGPKLLSIKGFALHTGDLLRLYLWVHITMGWAITMLLVAGLTGLIRT